MVDILAFLKYDHSESEIQKMMSELTVYMEMLGADYTVLFKTTENAVFNGALPNYNQDVQIKFEPNKFVILTRNNSGTGWMLKRILKEMGFECSFVVEWLDDEFPDDAFTEIDLTEKTIQKSLCLFKLKKALSDSDMEVLYERLALELQTVRYGAYSLRGRIPAFLHPNGRSYFISNIIADEYEKFLDFKNTLCTVEQQDINSQQSNEKFLQYFKKHKVFDGIFVPAGTQVMQWSVVTEDLEEIKKIIEKMDLPISTDDMIWGDVLQGGTTNIKKIPLKTSNQSVETEEFQLLCMKNYLETDEQGI